MIREGYDTAAEDSGQEARGRERQALGRGVEMLERLKDGKLQPYEATEALLYVRRLWLVFIEDLTRPENGLPEKLRADIISIGVWVLKEIELVPQGTGNLAHLVEINSIIRDALK